VEFTLDLFPKKAGKHSLSGLYVKDQISGKELLFRNLTDFIVNI
jgi:hypothetical protein